MHSPISIPPQAMALLMVDFQEEHRKDERFLAHDFDAAVVNGAALLAAARKSGVLVIHGQYVRDFAKVPARPFEVVGPNGEPAFSDSAATHFVALCAEVAPEPGELVFVKNDASCFAATDLLDHLKSRCIEWLVVAGAWTEACVAATVRDAMAAGLRVLLVKDACASGTALMHRTAILNLANRLLGGAVCDTARAAAIIDGGEARIWRHTQMVPFRYTPDNLASLYEDL
ncbi:MAG: isochorismatase family protein [Alphaproteobacteria bacterium]|nr:isochorismatase family protein [Alphaproteobacteria bacterium]